jgi:hypothetical protein
MPTFSRHSGATPRDDDQPTLVDTPPVGERDDSGAHARDRADETTVRNRPVPPQRFSTAEPTPVDRTDRTGRREPPVQPAPAGPRPRASLLATLGLITGVASALLVLSGPLAGYGVGLAGLALILSLGGISATGRRHVAGKSDAIIGLLLALGAIVFGVLALTGSLTWLGTDTDSAERAREWLDTRFNQVF